MTSVFSNSIVWNIDNKAYHSILLLGEIVADSACTIQIKDCKKEGRVTFIKKFKVENRKEFIDEYNMINNIIYRHHPDSERGLYSYLTDGKLNDYIKL